MFYINYCDCWEKKKFSNCDHSKVAGKEDGERREEGTNKKTKRRKKFTFFGDDLRKILIFTDLYQDI